MKIKSGDMWSCITEPNSLFLITTNSFLKKDGTLVMGKGIAKEARDRDPSIAVTLGNLILRKCGHLGKYGVIIGPMKKFGIFQVKYNFLEDANLDLIEFSATKLMSILNLPDYTGYTANLNYPGIGNGRLSRKEVTEVINKIFDDRVTLWVK